MESQDDARESTVGEGERKPRDEKGSTGERAVKHYAGWHDCGDAAQEE